MQLRPCNTTSTVGCTKYTCSIRDVITIADVTTLVELGNDLLFPSFAAVYLDRALLMLFYIWTYSSLGWNVQEVQILWMWDVLHMVVQKIEVG